MFINNFCPLTIILTEAIKVKIDEKKDVNSSPSSLFMCLQELFVQGVTGLD